ncbi:uncharacterized protein BO97DRAFT_165462 [Aspergillus homomorphus CBS 101889]|uniref:Uncharacterized protein n=1 Tax=Aspergillus homomorphus (strain CBS 101889) TaxID=1450537 RepID=A0A395HNH1_ASPHC|nr:hypothetical protein BO97DRAFT_165462 [Aspergillus homomorphus CBS 101889]RAL09502.1 hypothetical protein BO97DRAFT_165462 [Aspergillus homomorphus CBS 101889]
MSPAARECETSPPPPDLQTDRSCLRHEAESSVSLFLLLCLANSPLFLLRSFFLPSDPRCLPFFTRMTAQIASPPPCAIAVPGRESNHSTHLAALLVFPSSTPPPSSFRRI